MYKINIDSTSKLVFVEIQQLTEKMKKGLRKAFFDSGKNLVKTSSEGIKRKDKTGKYYKYKGKRIRASSTGEYPSNRSGNLRRGLGFNVQGTDKLIFGDKALYSKWLEDGTSKMGQRPFLRKSIQSNEKNIIENIIANTRRELGI